jgi:hypothetical protein
MAVFGQDFSSFSEEPPLENASHFTGLKAVRKGGKRSLLRL